MEETISGKVSWRERKVAEMLESLKANDAIIVSELSRLGRSMLECMEILSFAAQKRINVYSVKGAWRLDQSKIIAMAFSMAAEIERDLISQRTKEALRFKKAQGMKLGRPTGPGKSKLDPYRPEIESLLANGSTQKFIACRLSHDRGQSSQLAQKARTEIVQGPCTCIDISERNSMKTFRRNDPCPCGSDKKYKHCCLKKEETQAASDWRQAVPKALNWLMVKYPEALREAVDDGFFGSLNEKDYSQLQQHESFRGIRVNALEWLLAEGNISVNGQERRVSEMLLGQSGPQFSSPERQYLELLAAAPLRFYEVVGVTPGTSMSLKDMLLPEQEPVLVMEKAGSELLVKFDLLGTRILPVDGNFILSGAMFPIPRERGLELIGKLRKELHGLALASPQAKQILSAIISNYWLKLFTQSQMPVIIDQITGELILFITDHYRVQDWPGLEHALSREADVDGSRNEGWSRVFKGKDGLQRRGVAINLSERPDRIEVFYRTRKYADKGRPWFEEVAGRTVQFVRREISDPKEISRNKSPGELSPPPSPSSPVKLPRPEVMTEVIEKQIHQLYSDWADKPMAALDNRTPREAIKTPEGLERVKYLLHTYEQSEERQSKDQGRMPVSYDFLWSAL